MFRFDTVPEAKYRILGPDAKYPDAKYKEAFPCHDAA